MKKRRRYGTGRVFLHGRTWYAKYYVRGQPIRENSGCDTREEAEQFLKKRLVEAAAGEIEVNPSRATVADLCKLVIQDHRLRKLRDIKQVEWRFEAHIKSTIGKVVAARCSASQIRDFIETLRASGNTSDATINRILSIVRRGYTLAMREDPPIVRRAPYIPKLEEDNVRQGFLEREQYEHLLEEVPSNLKALYVCAYHVGTRKGELRKIRWDQVDSDAALIRLTVGQTKGKKARTLPIYGDMIRWIESQRASCPEGNPYVFHGQRKRPIGNRLDGWAEACERAGLAGLLFHDLRRSAVRNMKRAGVQDVVAMEISGHKTRAVFDRYNIVDEGDLGDAGEKLQQFFEKRKAERAAKLKRVK